ncbi:MAG TPA: hypothetical protein VNQ73_14355 [Ilumatobacter sp.]|nr:hypothetical protein [Ilumatobacter sp.]
MSGAVIPDFGNNGQVSVVGDRVAIYESVNSEGPDRSLRPGLIGEVWCDLFLEDCKAKGALHRVTQRALLFVELGLPVSQVLDALKVDQAGWEARVAAYEAWRAENRAAADRVEQNKRAVA